jgi:hypothetical protein
MGLDWKTGFEIELIAPRGKSRLDLARRVAARTGGTIERFFHAQQELSRVDGKPTFHNLTLAFAVKDREGRPVASFVDDLTLVDGLDQQASSMPGWYRMVTDDIRLVSLLLHNCDPNAELGAVLEPIGVIFGAGIETHPSGMVKVSDQRGASVAIATAMPGERERGCEIVTPPLIRDHAAALEALLADARAEGFGIPLEGALHIHFDAEPLLSASVIARLVTGLDRHDEALKDMVGTNPECRRLGPWPDALLDLVEDDDFVALEWPDARKALSQVGLSKFCDFNLVNIAQDARTKHTFEVRVLPVSLDAEEIVAQAALFASILDWARMPGGPDAGDSIEEFIGNLPLTPQEKARWIGG